MLNRLKVRLLAIFRRRKMGEELDEELRYHLEREIERHIAGGMEPQEARMAALRGFGGLEQKKEECRDARGLGLSEDFWQDLRFASRRLVKSRGFTIIAVLSLALGIGANTAIFSLLNTVLLRPLEIQNPERLVSLNFGSEKENSADPVFSYLNYRDLRDRNDVLDGLIAYRPVPISLSHDGINDRAWVYLATGNYFDVLGVKPARGRLFTPDDDIRPGAHPVTVITYDCWQKRFAGDPNIVGRNVMVNARSFTIIGVAPQGFYGTEIGYRADLWFPMIMLDQIVLWGTDLEDRGGQSYMVQGLLKPGVRLAQAEASLKAVMANLAREYPNDNQGKTIQLSPPGLFGSWFRRPVLGFVGVLMAAAGLVLLLASIGIFGVMCYAVNNRRREIGIRMALGATAGDVLGSVLRQGLRLTLIGMAIGLLAAWAMTRLLIRLLYGVSETDTLTFSGVSLLLISVALLASYLPARRASKVDPLVVLRHN